METFGIEVVILRGLLVLAGASFVQATVIIVEG